MNTLIFGLILTMAIFGVLQFNPTKLVEQNLKTIISYLSFEKNTCILLPELFLTDYIHNEPINQKHLSRVLKPLLHISKQNNVAIAGSLAIKHGPQILNSFVYIVDGKIKNPNYSKQRLFKHEKKTFTPGKKDIGFIEYRGITIATKICFDIIHPVSLSRAVCNQDVDLLFVSASVSVDYLLRIAAVRSLENQIITLFANRSYSKKGSVQFLGRSGFYYSDGTKKLCSKAFQGIQKISISSDDIKKLKNTGKELGIYG